jgi:hypothetical protein
VPSSPHRIEVLSRSSDVDHVLVFDVFHVDPGAVPSIRDVVVE